MQVKQTLKIKVNATPAQVPSTAFDALAGEGAHRADGLNVRTAVNAGALRDDRDGCQAGYIRDPFTNNCDPYRPK
jgi:hypothetical protein